MKFRCPNGCEVDSDTPFFYLSDVFIRDGKEVDVPAILATRDAKTTNRFWDGSGGVPEDYRNHVDNESDMVPCCIKCGEEVERAD